MINEKRCGFLLLESTSAVASMSTDSNDTTSDASGTSGDVEDDDQDKKNTASNRYCIKTNTSVAASADNAIVLMIQVLLLMLFWCSC